MLKIINILNHKCSVIIALIPVVNILYLLFHLVTVRNEVTNAVMLIACSLIPPLCTLVPDTWDWLAVHFVLSAVSLWCICRSRDKYNHSFGFPFPKKHAFSLFMAIFWIANSGWLVPGIRQSNQVSDYMDVALKAIVHDKEETWKELIHPVYGTELLNLEDFKRNLQAEGIELSMHFSRYSRSSFHYVNVEDGSAIEMEIRITSNEVVYIVTATYQMSENGNGFIEFDIVEAYPE